jgi:hypothetical protein
MISRDSHTTRKTVVWTCSELVLNVVERYNLNENSFNPFT